MYLCINMENLLKKTDKNSSPLVSFIIACYNLPTDMLTQCVESILKLSLRASEREIILVDDGSKECAVNSLGALADQLIYIRQRNQGLSAARNTGLQLATGKYIQFIDGDDYLLQVPYEHCLDHIRYNDADMVLFDFSRGEEATTTFTPEDPVNGTEYMLQNNIHGTAWGYIFKRSILGELRFTPGIFHEDEEFTPQLMLRAEKVYATKVKAYMYRWRENSIISSSDKELIATKRDDMLGVITRLNELTDQIPIREKLAIQRRVAQLTMDYIYNIILQSRSYSETLKATEALKEKGLFPLPNRDYTMKYKWFRMMTSSNLGLRMLVHTLPYTHKER